MSAVHANHKTVLGEANPAWIQSVYRSNHYLWKTHGTEELVGNVTYMQSARTRMWKSVQTANLLNKIQEEELVQLEYVVSHIGFYVETLATNKYYHLGYILLDAPIKEGLYWANSGKKTLTNVASITPWSRVLNWIKERKQTECQHSFLFPECAQWSQRLAFPTMMN